ncbi:LysR family transcriptional regulator [Paludibacterium purpuratum]|uniref:LysR family transcriptional regulator n=1 Tax=Paludibacterium purpuratum TaxID=1144873 RepID=A0A4V3DU25_9NEIS|nr:LysR family transcriptional regulator [Paludibacterium purpuratum]TDR70538.1 LysR family transcriptional regulator [Paludibacterium purpuratum]
MSTTDRLSGVAAFVHAAEAGNFSAAAERMHLSRSAVAKSVARLEERLGTRLFHRTTRSQSLTEDGLTFYQRCARVLAELEQAEEELAKGRDEAVGKVRITMPVQLGRSCIAPALFALAQRQPGLQLEMSFTDRCVDLIEEGFDLAVRSGPLPDSSSLKMRKLGEQELVLCAAPAYLARRGTPRTLSDLAAHDGIFYGRADRIGEWRFLVNAREEVSAVQARFCMDDLDVMLTAVKEGLGIARLPTWLLGDALQSGYIKQILHGHQVAAYPVHIVWPTARQLSRKLRVVIDELAAVVPSSLRL